MPRFRFCQHTKDNGELCGSPAMRKKSYCYHHMEVVRRRRRLAMLARNRRELAEAILHDDKISRVISYGEKILGCCSRVASEDARL